MSKIKISDPNLLFYYSEDPRVKLKDISSSLRKSSPRLKYNISKMDKEKIVDHAHPIIDYSCFGMVLFRVYFKGGYVSEKDKNKLVHLLQKHPNIVSIYELSGEFDLVLEMEAPNASRFNKELKKLISIAPTLNNYKIVLNIVTHLYPRSYLLPKKSPINISWTEKDIIIGGDRPTETFSNEEKNILFEILHHPKIRFTTLAKKTKMNVKTAVSIFNNLKQRKILKGFNQIIDTNKLGIFKYRLFLKLHNLSPEREVELMDFLLKTPEVVLVHKTVGDWEMEIDLEALEKEKIRYLISQLKEEFTDLIETFNSIEFYQYYKKAFLPMSIFEAEQPSQHL